MRVLGDWLGGEDAGAGAGIWLETTAAVGGEVAGTAGAQFLEPTIEAHALVNHRELALVRLARSQVINALG